MTSLGVRLRKPRSIAKEMYKSLVGNAVIFKTTKARIIERAIQRLEKSQANDKKRWGKYTVDKRKEILTDDEARIKEIIRQSIVEYQRDPAFMYRRLK